MVAHLGAVIHLSFRRISVVVDLISLHYPFAEEFPVAIRSASAGIFVFDLGFGSWTGGRY